MANWRDFLDADARPGRYMAWKEVARETGLSRTTAWRLQKQGEFPPPYALSPGRVAYRADEVEAWRISRDHSVARPARRTDPTSAPRQAARPGHTRPAAPTTGAGSPDAAQASTSTAAGPTNSAGRPSRRSAHAQAIAQQMRFDF